MNRHNLILVAVALVSMLGGVVLYDFLQPIDSEDPASHAQTPAELHSIPLTDLDNRQTLLRDWQGRLLVINFWAPWCAPCRREIPSLVKVQEEYRSRGVTILGIAFDNEPQVRRFAEEYNINYPLFLTSNRAAMYNAALGNPSGSLPFTALLDHKLRIIYRHNGELTLDELRTQLDKHLQVIDDA